MKWIELILVRAVDGRHKSKVQQLLDHLPSDELPNRPKAITLYRNAFVETDICVHLQWEKMKHHPGKSDIGIEFAAALEEFGRVHHTLWIQDETSKNGKKP